MSVLDTLKRFNADGLSLDELLEISAKAKALKTEYESYQVDTPEVLASGLTQLRRAINTKVADDLDRKTAELRAKRATLATVEEKRQALDAELQTIEETRKRLQGV